MKRFVFTVTLSGIGRSEADAWDDAVCQFCEDPGEGILEYSEPFDEEED